MPTSLTRRSLDAASTGRGRSAIMLCAVLLAAGSPAQGPPAEEAAAAPADADLEVGTVVIRTHAHGAFACYVPKRTATRILALIHGTIPEHDDGLAAARGMVELFRPDADRRGVVLVAPAYSDADFGGHAGPGGGYRGLFGRRVGADVFLNAVIDDVLAAASRADAGDGGNRHGRLDGPFDLLGHSAGGQFVSRYLVMNLGRVRTAVICAAGTFAFPDPAYPWTEGMAPLRRTWRWGDDPEGRIEVVPDPAGWLATAQMRVVVLAGERDPTDVPKVDGQRGGDVRERSRLWVESMNALAREHGRTGRVRYRMIPRAGHSLAELLPDCRRALWP